MTSYGVCGAPCVRACMCVYTHVRTNVRTHLTWTIGDHLATHAHAAPRHTFVCILGRPTLRQTFTQLQIILLNHDVSMSGGTPNAGQGRRRGMLKLQERGCNAGGGGGGGEGQGQ